MAQPTIPQPFASESSPPETTPQQAQLPNETNSNGSFDRLSLPFAARLPILVSVAGTSGVFMGLVHGSKESGLRFRAEHAHKLPTTQTGWYLYHKSKNYHVMLGGIKEGGRMAVKCGFWSGLFAVFEEGVDRGRAAVVRQYRTVRWNGEEREELVAGNRDFVSTMLAGLGTAGVFSAWNRFPLPTAVRLAKMGAWWGLGFGVLQDAVNLLRGRRLGYVEFVKRHTIGMGGEDDVKETDDVAPAPG